MADLSLMSSVYHKQRDEFVTRIASASQPEENVIADDEEVDEDERAENRKRVQDEMESGPPSNGAAGGGGAAGLDLLDLDGSVGDDMPSVQPVQKQQVLPATQAGQGGKTGFGIAAALVRQGAGCQLMMTFSNSSPVPINGFAIQVNKNPFGIGANTALVAPDLMPGSTQEVTLAMTPNSQALLSNTAPTNPLFLQIAIKNSLDIFYFNVPFDLPAVLSTEGIAKDQFSPVWQRVGDTKKQVVTGTTERTLTQDSLRSLLANDNIHYVAQRQKDDNTMFVYVSATTSNNAVLLAGVTLNRGSNVVELEVRTEHPSLMPLFEAALRKRLSIR